MEINSKCRILITIFFTALSITASESSGGLTEENLSGIKSSLTLSAEDKATINSLTNNELTALILSHDFLSQHNNLFNHKIKTRGITDQKRSGRCWLFAGLNMLRPVVIEKYNLPDFEFSQNYLYFWDKMEKANYFLERIIETADKDLLNREVEEILKRPIGDGGLWSYVVNLIDKYGVVPKNAMPETYNSSHSWYMNDLISAKLREFAVILRRLYRDGVPYKEIEERKLEMLKTVYRMLVFNLGQPPSKFEWRYEDKEGNLSELKTYTPAEFYDEVVDTDLKDYLAIMHYPGKEYNSLYQFDNARNIYDAEDPMYINLKIEKLKDFTIKSILNDEPVWFACDIIKGRESEKGILSTKILDFESLYRIDFKIDKEERIRYRESYGNHAMVFTGVDIREDRPVKWLVEDSHGSERGHNGHWTMYDDWFDEYLYTVIINKKYLPRDIKLIMEQKPVHLPPWDPMCCILRE